MRTYKHFLCFGLILLLIVPTILMMQAPFPTSLAESSTTKPNGKGSRAKSLPTIPPSNTRPTSLSTTQPTSLSTTRPTSLSTTRPTTRPGQKKVVSAKTKRLLRQVKQLLHRPKTISFPCEPKPCRLSPRVVWEASFQELQESSPAAADLNGDGILDLVVGGASMFAVDGRSGKQLWSKGFPNDVFGTPILLDVNCDKIPDVLASGRFTNFYALHGKTGKILWDLRSSNPKLNIPKVYFHTPVLVSDMDRDGIRDIVIAQGGDPEDKGITTGRVYQVSGLTGRVIKWIYAPDKREIYSVPAYLKTTHGDLIVLGTGGERIPGHMFALKHPSLREIWRFPTPRKGFIASPLLFQGFQRSYHDVIGATFGGLLVRLDGKSGKKLWSHYIPGHETYSSPAVGRFQTTRQYDVIAAYSKGVWPEYYGATLVWVDGRTGKRFSKHSLGTFNLSSPLVADLNGDQFDEVIISTNYIDRQKWDLLRKVMKKLPSQERTAFDEAFGGPLPKPLTTNYLIVFDGKTRRILWSQRFQGFSASTPLLKDLDGNGKLDLTYAYMGRLIRLEFPSSVPVNSAIWNQFRGPNADGVYPWKQSQKPVIPKKPTSKQATTVPSR